MDSTANQNTAYPGISSREIRPDIEALISFQRYLPAAAFYFFLNHAGLPNGLFYTTLLSPLLYVWLYLKKQRWLTARFLLILSPFVLADLVLGIQDPFYYLRSMALMWTAYVTVYTLVYFLLRCASIDRLFDQLIFINFFVALFALVTLPTPLRAVLWHDDSNVLAGVSSVSRLSLLNTEPSVYAELMLPLMVFAILRLLRHGVTRNVLYLLMIGVPFLLCQSFGGFSMCAAGVGVSLLVGYRKILRRPRNLALMAILVVALIVLLVTGNPISQRVTQVLSGGDSSVESRTTLSFLVAYTLASAKSLWWGVGIGQAKLLDVSDLGVGFTVGIIPNAIAGIFAELGIIGVLACFTVQIYLFFRTKVWGNSFRLAMFVVAFITQVTGSYTTDVQQYMLWCFAFFPFFPALDVRGDIHKKPTPPLK
jgi:hypothetical protein